MAKVTGPLMSIEASGQFAESIVFDKRGFARGYTIPSNPRTALQQATRLAMKAAQSAAKHLNTTARTALTSKLGYRWNAGLLAEALGANLANFEAAKTQYSTLSVDEKAALDDAAEALSMQPVNVPDYDQAVTAQIALYAVLLAYNRIMVPETPITIINIGTLFA